MENLKITASPTSSENDFDFFVGKWKVKNRKLNKRLANCVDWTEFEAKSECRKLLKGFANTDSFHATFDGKPFEAMTLRLFNPLTKLWSIYWADSNIVVLDVPQIGSFDGKIGEFLARDIFENKPVIVKFNWDATDENAPVWSQAFSADEGETWEWNWFMYFEREK
ncbi:MAG TPA: hypothetical protein PKY59_18805 [Pyrinomonadaceae bacterium]|nr:hypothetical protein [Pyrinomonadaceae bacterium]